MRRVPRWLVFTAIVVTLAIGAVSSLAIGTVRQSFPALTGTITLPTGSTFSVPYTLYPAQTLLGGTYNFTQ